MSIAYLFPGQGAQSVGMGKDLYEAFPQARDVFDAAEEAAGLPLKKLCFEGPEEQLNRTDMCQSAIFTVSAAVLAVLGEAKFNGQKPAFAAGLSLGEYSALYAAGAMDLPTAVKLLVARGQYMQEAATAVPSSMVSLLGADEEIAQKVCDAARGTGVLVPANFNAPGQIVVSGTVDACKRAMEVAKDCGAGGGIELKVAGAFHSPLMAPAAEKLAVALESAEIRTLDVPVVSNVTARAHEDVAGIRKLLLEQLTSGVRWQQSCEFLVAQGCDAFLEIGPGRVLAGLMRKLDRRANITSLNGREALEKFLAAAC